MIARPELKFWHRLAAQLGTTLEECKERVSSREYSSWQAYWELEPFGWETQMLAMLCAVVANAHGGRQGKKPFMPEDFLPVKPPKHLELQDSSETKANLRAALAGFGA